MRTIGSVTLTILLLAAVAAASAAGTLLSQEDAHRAVYGTWWFAVLLGALAVNLAAGTIGRLPLRRRDLGLVLTHLAVVLILAGTLVDRMFGERGMMILSIGSASDTIASPGRETTLPFMVGLARFEVERRPGAPAGHVTAFRSTLHFLEGGRRVKQAVVELNRPVTHDGYTFFQSRYDELYGHWSGLEVVYDPGVPLVYAGYALFIIGLIFLFFIQPPPAPREGDAHD